MSSGQESHHGIISRAMQANKNRRGEELRLKGQHSNTVKEGGDSVLLCSEQIISEALIRRDFLPNKFKSWRNFNCLAINQSVNFHTLSLKTTTYYHNENIPLLGNVACISLSQKLFPSRGVRSTIPPIGHLMLFIAFVCQMIFTIII